MSWIEYSYFLETYSKDCAISLGLPYMAERIATKTWEGGDTGYLECGYNGEDYRCVNWWLNTGEIRSDTIFFVYPPTVNPLYCRYLDYYTNSRYPTNNEDEDIFWYPAFRFDSEWSPDYGLTTFCIDNLNYVSAGSYYSLFYIFFDFGYHKFDSGTYYFFGDGYPYQYGTYTILTSPEGALIDDSFQGVWVGAPRDFYFATVWVGAKYHPEDLDWNYIWNNSARWSGGGVKGYNNSVMAFDEKGLWYKFPKLSINGAVYHDKNSEVNPELMIAGIDSASNSTNYINKVSLDGSVVKDNATDIYTKIQTRYDSFGVRDGLKGIKNYNIIGSGTTGCNLTASIYSRNSIDGTVTTNTYSYTNDKLPKNHFISTPNDMREHSFCIQGTQDMKVNEIDVDITQTRKDVLE